MTPYERIDALEQRVRYLEGQIVALAAAIAVNAANTAALMHALGEDAIPGEQPSSEARTRARSKAN